MHQVGLAQPDAAVQEQRVEGDPVILGDPAGGGVGQFVRPTRDEAVEGEARVQRCAELRDQVAAGRGLLGTGFPAFGVRVGVGVDIEVHADAGEAVADLVVDAEDALQVHVAFERRLDRPQLDAAMLGDGGDTGRQTAGQARQHDLDRRRRLVLGREHFRMVGFNCKALAARLLFAETEEAADGRPAMRAVHPLARGAPGELRGLGGRVQRLAGTEQCLHIDTVVHLPGCVLNGILRHFFILSCVLCPSPPRDQVRSVVRMVPGLVASPSPLTNGEALHQFGFRARRKLFQWFQ